jgi:hypothetical protein
MMNITYTLHYSEKTRQYSIAEWIVADNGEFGLGDIVEELGGEFGKALRKFNRLMRDQV